MSLSNQREMGLLLLLLLLLLKLKLKSKSRPWWNDMTWFHLVGLDIDEVNLSESNDLIYGQQFKTSCLQREPNVLYLISVPLLKSHQVCPETSTLSRMSHPSYTYSYAIGFIYRSILLAPSLASSITIVAVVAVVVVVIHLHSRHSSGGENCPFIEKRQDPKTMEHVLAFKYFHLIQQNIGSTLTGIRRSIRSTALS